MKNFGRAVRLTLRRPLAIFGACVCSVMVAVFWGANVGAVYPFVEAVFRGDSMHEWVDNQIEASKAKSTEFRTTIERLEHQRSAAAPDHRRPISRAIQFQRDRLAAEEKALAAACWLRPYIRRYLPGEPFPTLIFIVIVVLSGTLLKGLFLMGHLVLVARLGELTAMELRKQCYHRTLEMDLAAFGQGRSGDLMSRFTGDVNSVTAGVSALFGKSLGEPLKMAACIAGAAFISWRLLAFSLLVAPLALFLMYVLARSIKRANRRVMEQMAAFYNRLAESFSAIKIIKAFTMEPYERSRFHQNVKTLYRKAMRLALYNSLTRLNTEVLGVGVICLAILAGGYLVLHQETHLLGVRMTNRPLSFGALMVFYGFLIGISDPARKMADVVSSLQAGAAAADRVYSMLDRTPAIADPAHPRRLAAEGQELVFEHVSFYYTPDEPVLQDIYLHIPFGETLAIVGPNGCGKSTLVNLIPRFYDPVRGAVRLGDTDVRDVRLRDLRRQIGLVTQQTVLFDDTVWNNIRYGSPQASADAVLQAAQKAHAHRFIEELLENGYDTNVGERGGRLSGGQRQRLALARAMLRDPLILILDEATSQIDPESERLTHQALEAFKTGRTTILITHRLTTLALADRILVMDAGRVAGVGPHDELIQHCEVYQRLYHVGMRKAA